MKQKGGETMGGRGIRCFQTFDIINTHFLCFQGILVPYRTRLLLQETFRHFWRQILFAIGAEDCIDFPFFFKLPTQYFCPLLVKKYISLCKKWALEPRTAVPLFDKLHIQKAGKGLWVKQIRESKRLVGASESLA